MNDNDRQLIELVLQKAGEAGAHGWSYLVHWTFVDGLLSIVAYAAILAICAWVALRAFRWKVKVTDEHGHEEPIMYVGHVARVGVLIAMSIVGYDSICGVERNLAAVFAPEGAAIHSVLR